MLKNDNIVWTPLKQPFIPFVVNQPPRRPSSSKINRSNIVNQQNYGHQKQINYSISQDSHYESRTPPKYAQMLQRSRNISKSWLDQDATNLRQQIWLKIEGTFRKIWQYGEQFYDSLNTVITQMTSQRPYETKSSNKLIWSSIKKCLQNNQSFYNKHRMQKISKNVIDKISKYLEEMLEKYLSTLFHLSNQINITKHDDTKDNMIKTQRVKNQQINKRHEYKSMSAQKFYSRDQKQVDIKWNKDKQFQQISDKIKENKQKNNTAKPPDTFPVRTLDNPYGLNIQTGKFMKDIQTVVNFNNTYFSYKNSRQNSRAPHSVSKANTTVKQRIKNLNNISISPVISRVNIPQMRKQTISYKISTNQQSLVCEWCQQLKLSPQPQKIPITNKPNPILSLTQQITKNTDDTAVCLTFCNNFNNIAIGCKSALIYIYELESGLNKLVTKLQGHSTAICCLCQHMGLLFSGGDMGCSSIYVWDMSTWTVRSKLNYHSAAISSITGIPNTDYIFSCSLDKTLKLYNYQTSLITSCHKSPYSYMKAVYYEQEQIVAVMTPGVNVDLFFVQLGGEEYRLFERKGIVCGGRIGIMEKGGCGGSDLLVVGLYAAGIQLYNIREASLVKKIQLGIGPICSIITFNRNNKSQYPFILYACIGSVAFHTVNSETQFTTQLNVKGNMDFQLGCGVGPLLVINNRLQIAWVSQREHGSQLFITTFSIH